MIEWFGDDVFFVGSSPISRRAPTVITQIPGLYMGDVGVDYDESCGNCGDARAETPSDSLYVAGTTFEILQRAR